ncbi:hypothetical protein A5634_11575 [Mycobacterium asiaticum]|uniref:Integral membrane bound transporter domain-containing protein n=1 Tax=Mycobacterium asiaticum TaxID=1790 RepID=A0A1A3NIE6_MYCAS|nr:FUSC family protein [Mycobacterium asiaticum]OBK20819.1 hypothetical protein A5634_11575 [Mycobacterium asiaticum]
MATSLVSRTAEHGTAAFRRLRSVLFPIAQTATASGLAWYLAHDVVGHHHPFFAPVAAAVCLSASNVLRTQRAVQMIIGVTFGIVLGAAVQTVLGTGAIAIAVAVLISLSGAVLIGQGYIAQGLMFFNQITVSATLVITVSRSGDIVERLQDTLIGGGLAIAFAALLFPGDPLKVLRNARRNVLAAVHDVLVHCAEVVGGRAPAPDWPLPDVERVNQQLALLMQARISAKQTLAAPRRWGVRDRAVAADRQTVHVAVLAGSSLHLARVVTTAAADGPQAVRAATDELVAGVALADADPAAAAAHVAAARREASALATAARTGRDWALVEGVQTCLEDLQQVIHLAQ